MNVVLSNLAKKNEAMNVKNVSLDELSKRSSMVTRTVGDTFKEGDVIALPKVIDDNSFKLQPIRGAEAVILPVMVYRDNQWTARNFFPTSLQKMVNVAKVVNAEENIYENVDDYRQPLGDAAIAARNEVSLVDFFKNNLGRFIKIDKMHKEVLFVATKFDDNRQPVEYAYKKGSWGDYVFTSNPSSTDPYAE